MVCHVLVINIPVRPTDRTVGVEILPDNRLMREAGASPGIIEHETIATNPNISRSIPTPSKPRMIRLREPITRATGRRRSTTSVNPPKS